MIAAKQPTFRFLFSGSRSITSAKTERTFGTFSSWLLKPSDDDDALCGWGSTIKTFTPKADYYATFRPSKNSRDSRAPSVFPIFDNHNNVYIPHSKIMYFLLYFLQKATRVFSHSRQLTKLVAKVCTQNDWKHFKPCSDDRHFYLAVFLREFALLKKLDF